MSIATPATITFGEHLTLDGYFGDADKLNNRELVLRCLSELPNLLHMRKLAEPEVYFSEGGTSKDNGGWTGFVVIAESHISIHTFPDKGFVSIDAYTCINGMDVEFIIKYFKNAFSLEEVETHHILRGTRFPV